MRSAPAPYDVGAIMKKISAWHMQEPFKIYVLIISIKYEQSMNKVLNCGEY
jgi:hypothetical protein